MTQNKIQFIQFCLKVDILHRYWMILVEYMSEKYTNINVELELSQKFRNPDKLNYKVILESDILDFTSC